ncbi:MAG: rod shape-determining protein RodA [Elusimicrobiota bacterium]
MKPVLKKFDWLLFGDVIILTLTGILFIFSAQLKSGNPMFYVIKQSTALGLGIAAMLLVVSIRYELYSEYTDYFYIFGFLLLVLVLFFGTKIRGSKSWFDFGKFAFQPSEIAKITFVLYLARFIEKNQHSIKKVSKLAIVFFATVVYIYLILAEPDFSSASVFVPVFLGMIYAGGLPKKIVLAVIIFFIVALTLPFLEIWLSTGFFTTGSWVANFRLIYVSTVFLITGIIWFLIKAIRLKMTFKKYKSIVLVVLLGLITAVSISGFLKDYQRKRLIAFINPALDPLGSGYNILQSRIAIGSGKFLGRGIFQGTQTQLGFIPDQHTDYIFAVLAEEGGAVFSFTIILLYVILISRGISIAKNATTRFGSLTAVGITIMFAYYIILNLGMITGIMPVAGVPLPFISYGGSSLITNMIAIGLLINIHVRRYTY